MGWGDFFSDPVGTITDNVVNPIVDTASSVVNPVVDTVSNLGQGAIDTVSNAGQGIANAVGDLGTSIDQTVRDNIPGGWTLPAMFATGYYADPSMFASLGGADTAGVTGLDVGGAGAGADTWGTSMAADAAASVADTVGAAEFGQGSNVGLKMAGSEGLTGSQGLGTSLYSPTGTTAAGTGLAAPTEGYFSGLTAPTTTNMTLSGLLNGIGSTIAKNPMTTARLGASLYDMYARNQMAKQQQAQLAQNRADITGSYAEGSPEMKALQQEMARKDAAAGRNSQYGTRAADIAGIIAKYKLNALQGMQQNQNSLMNQAMANRYGTLNSLFYNAPSMIKGG